MIKVNQEKKRPIEYDEHTTITVANKDGYIGIQVELISEKSYEVEATDKHGNIYMKEVEGEGDQNINCSNTDILNSDEPMTLTIEDRAGGYKKKKYKLVKIEEKLEYKEKEEKEKEQFSTPPKEAKAPFQFTSDTN